MRIQEISENSREAVETTDEAWSQGYKRSIDCGNPRGFSQKAHCAARRKRQSGGDTKSKPVRENTDLLEAKRKRARTLIDGMIKTLIARGRTRDEAIADLKKQIDSRFYEQVMGDDAIISESKKLTRSDPVERWVAAFKASSHPKFAGKSPEQRERMARAAHYRAVQNHNPYAGKAKVPVREADDLDELRIDNRGGWGAVPFNQSVDYHGLRVAIRPSMFLRLAHELEHPHSADDIEKHLRSGGTIGAPFLMVAIPQDWFEGDMSHPAEIYGHEGRNRMNAVLKTEGDEPVETHLFFGGGVRNRNLTPEIVVRLNQEVVSQRGRLIKGPWFSTAVSEVAKVRISKDPNDLGAYVYDKGKPEPTVMLPLSRITSVLEPDEYHAEKPGAIDRVERMAKAIRAGKRMPAILVRRHGDGYQVLDGHHRFKAYRQVGAEAIPARVVDPENITGDIDENFADGKGPGRPGDSQRHGIPKGATMAQLQKAAKAPGRKGQLARWQINMRRGKAKANEAIAPHGGPEDELRMMRAGTKPAALMLDYHFDTLYRPLADEMGWEVVRFNIGSDTHYVVAQPGERNRAERIARMVSDANKVIKTGARLRPEYHRELGTLLGYGKADIDHFIKNIYGDNIDEGVWDTVSDFSKSAVDTAYSVGKSAADTAYDLGKSAVDTAYDVGKSAVDSASAFGRSAADTVTLGGYKYARAGADYIAKQALKNIGYGSGTTYDLELKQEIEKLIRDEEENPRAVGAGRLAGVIGAIGAPEVPVIGGIAAGGYKAGEIAQKAAIAYKYAKQMIGMQEGDVIHNRFATKQAAKNQTPYVFNSDIADSIPLYDPHRRGGVAHKSPRHARGDEIPFDSFDVNDKSERTSDIVGIIGDKRVVVATTRPDIARVLADAYNRKGFTTPDIEMVKEADINPDGAALTVFDMDETLFHTKARVYVVRDGEIVHRLSNQEYNTYHLKPGETFDYREFRDARFFHDTSVPIERMWRKAQNLLNNIGKRPGSRVIIVTARTDLDDRETFLDTFRKHGLDIDKVHVHRAGNLPVPAAAAKKAIIATYLNTGQFDTVRLIDDAESNLRSFLELRGDYPGTRFSAYLVLPGGNMAKYEP